MDDEIELKYIMTLECLKKIKKNKDKDYEILHILSKLFDQAYQMGVEDGYKVAMELDDLMSQYYR